MGFAKQWTDITGSLVRSPGSFFDEYDRSHGIGYPLAFMLLSFVVVVLPLTLLSVVFNVTAPSEAALGAVIFLGLGIGFWVLGVVEALLAHGIAYLLGARGAAKTLDAYAFPTIIRYGLWWIPLVNIALGLYGLYLQIKGLATFHDISLGRAAIAAVLAALLYLPALIVITAVIGAFVLDLGAQA